MAQEAGGLDDISSTPTSSSTSGAGDSSSLVNGGDSPIKRTVSPAAGVVVGVAERNSKTGVSLTISPPTSLDLEGAGAHCVGLTGDYEATGEVVARSNNGSISSDIVFVDCSVAAAAALRAKGPVLSTHEEECTKEFLEIVNGARVSKGVSPLSWNAGVKFLMARKFNVRRSLELYNQHQVSRHDEGLFNFDPESEPLRSELLSGKFTVLPARDLGGAAIAVFTAKCHQPSNSPHESTLKGVVYQLDAALEDPQTQRCGLIFIYDMSDSKYSNFDYDLSIKILSLLKGGYPARLKKVLIVTAPLWFRAPFRILRLFVREKLRDRVFTVSVPQLGAHIPNNALPRTLGGQLDSNHSAWLAQCHQILSSTDLWGSFTDDTIPFDQFSDSNDTSIEENSKDIGSDGVSNGIKKMRRNGQSTPSPTPNSSGSSGFSDDDSLPFEEKAGLTLPEFVEHVRQKGRRGLLDEYAEIVSKSPEGLFNASRLRGNVNKNRYSDVLCFDHTRVILSTDPAEPDTSDYINANYVDGYKQRNAFISTQGPLPRTFSDFWKMVWEQTVVLIVMTTRCVERGRTKCGQYWPPDADSTVVHEGFKLKNLEVDTRPDFAVTRLQITHLKTNETREVSHLQFLSWPDYGVPSSAAATLKFIQTMRNEQSSRVVQLGDKWDGHPHGPPIVVHCSAGIGRTGTLCTMDICIKRLVDQGTIDVMGTVERIRSQRSYSIQVPEQYLFCHAAMIEYALSNTLITHDQVEGLPDLLAEAQQLAVEREREAHLAQKNAEAAAALASRAAAVITPDDGGQQQGDSTCGECAAGATPGKPNNKSSVDEGGPPPSKPPFWNIPPPLKPTIATPQTTEQSNKTPPQRQQPPVTTVENNKSPAAGPLQGVSPSPKTEKATNVGSPQAPAAENKRPTPTGNGKPMSSNVEKSLNKVPTNFKRHMLKKH
ncbi:tyrosine-protein phosphatase non-receptor type 9 isoform X2 [Folsomia candida]|uniref:Tyrosine-protein phosphatase non-receptor type 9 n=1 Tax=Folsomia candida TaxID=158441 RepID=A0A226EZ08_FOLCA|nr:tyrosine-protein phosphatase non-receptor type 9 isoform X2 [Folsomia candida]OXA62769.1 Tyrosine-protein phosphatase non-receptor type 9 [Folsomia candida]